MIEVIEPSLSELVFVSYDGEFDDDTGAYHGPGTAVLDNNCKYEGLFSQGLMHGKGKFSWADGVEYEGDFVRGKVSGKAESYAYTRVCACV